MNENKGVLLVGLAGLTFSFGGAISRYINVQDPWVVVFWRSLFAFLFLLLLLFLQNGWRTSLIKVFAMGKAGIAFGVFCAGSMSTFAISLFYATVAQVVLIIACAPLLTALILFFYYHEKIPFFTWLAIFVSIVGVLLMVYESIAANYDLAGILLPLLTAICLSMMAIISRKNHQIGMLPATMLGASFATIFALIMILINKSVITPSGSDWYWLFAFGVINLGLALALFAAGASLIPATITSLLLLLEPVFAPIWTWIFHNEVPSKFTFIGGGVILLAIFFQSFIQIKNFKFNND